MLWFSIPWKIASKGANKGLKLSRPKNIWCKADDETFCSFTAPENALLRCKFFFSPPMKYGLDFFIFRFSLKWIKGPKKRQPSKKQRKICTEEFFVLVAISLDNNSPTPHIIFIPNLAPEKEEIASEDRGFESRWQQNNFFVHLC